MGLARFSSVPVYPAQSSGSARDQKKSGDSRTGNVFRAAPEKGNRASRGPAVQRGFQYLLVRAVNDPSLRQGVVEAVRRLITGGRGDRQRARAHTRRSSPSTGQRTARRDEVGGAHLSGLGAQHPRAGANTGKVTRKIARIVAWVAVCGMSTARIRSPWKTVSAVVCPSQLKDDRFPRGLGNRSEAGARTTERQNRGEQAAKRVELPKCYGMRLGGKPCI